MDILNQSHDVTHFDCGNSKINDFIKNDALSYQADDMTMVRVLLQENCNKVRGYYTLSSRSLESKLISGYYNYNHHAPALLLGRLGVDKACQNRKLGQKLIKSCFDVALKISEQIGIYAIMLDVEKDNQAAIKLYEAMEFQFGASQEDQNLQKMYIPIEIVKLIYS